MGRESGASRTSARELFEAIGGVEHKQPLAVYLPRRGVQRVGGPEGPRVLGEARVSTQTVAFAATLRHTGGDTGAQKLIGTDPVAPSPVSSGHNSVNV